jgi:hypothetical protein
VAFSIFFSLSPGAKSQERAWKDILGPQGRKQFFSEEKNQKTFALDAGTTAQDTTEAPGPAGHKSLFGSFSSEKEHS